MKALFYVILTVLMLGWAPLPALAQDAPSDDIFVARDIAVDVTAENSVLARERALTQARYQAFDQLLKRLLIPGDYENFEMPDEDTLFSLIQDFEIQNEQLSTVRYVANLTLRFRPAEVRQYLGDLGLRFTDVESAPVLVLPFYQTDFGATLWQDPNPWRDIWLSKNFEDRMVPIYAPLGDLNDISAVAAEDVLSGQYAPVQYLLDRYDVGEVIVAIAEPTPLKSLKIHLFSSDDGALEHVTTLDVSPDTAGEEAVLNKATEETVAFLQKRWKEKVSAGEDSLRSLRITVSFSGLPEWLEIQGKIGKLPGVQGFDVVSLKPREASVDLKYRGSEDLLRRSLAAQGLNLSAPVNMEENRGYRLNSLL